MVTAAFRKDGTMPEKDPNTWSALSALIAAAASCWASMMGVRFGDRP